MKKFENLTPINEANESEIETMVDKAAGAFKNWQVVDENEQLLISSGAATPVQVENAKLRYSSEYKAMVKCIELFVTENNGEIQDLIEKVASNLD